ncbi:MAG: NAD(+)/NADH kinase [Clostridia bacterium]|nr:NAD(+)/NADH kinase [Clostridia bacterium]
MKKIYLVMHQRKPDTVSIIRQLCSEMKTAGLRPIAEPWLSSVMADTLPWLEYASSAKDCDAVLAVGGDGTFLRANAVALVHELPLLGINLGTVGFLSEVEWDQIGTACHALANDSYTVESRMLLEARVGDKRFLALNDIVLSRGGYARLIGMNVHVEKERLDPYIGDGLIISTPTGSTGYSLSAGGPVVHPSLECMIMTPVCCHSLQHRPVVTASTQTITIELDDRYNSTAQVDVDGQQAVYLQAGEKLYISRAAKCTHLIHIDPNDFFSTIRIKLAEWSH